MDEEGIELNQEQIFEQLQFFLSTFGGELNILEEQIDVNFQVEYFNRSALFKSDNDLDVLLERVPELYDNSISIELKQEILCRLASIDDVKAYRAIEVFHKNTNEDLNYWSRLALEESKMLLRTRLLDEKQLFISTGLGGKGNKLRYFLVLLSQNDNQLSLFQQEIIKKEFHYIFKQHQSEVEEIRFEGQFTTLLVLVPVNELISDLFNKAILECNQYGNFLKKDCIITNVKSLGTDEIKEIIRKESSNELDQ